MPELPDVVGFKRYLDATSLHQRIQSTTCLDERFVKEVPRRSLQQRLKGAELESSRRWGKWLFVQLTSGGHLVLHFGMSGQLEYGEDRDGLPDHTRFLLRFDNHRRLTIISQRMIGQVSYTDDVAAFAAAHDLGPDALDDELDADTLIQRLGNRQGTIKSTLMNQSVIAGIGNVYADEILFQTGVHPGSRVARLDESVLRNLHTVMRRVLRVAARKGGNGRKAPRSWLLGGRSSDAPCPRCGAQLTSATISGRTAWFCPRCQPKA